MQLPNQGHVSGQQQQVMLEPPQVLTTKDTKYIQDAMSWQLTAMKKCAHFARECTDSDIQRIIDETGRMHQRHYQQLLALAATDNQTIMNQLQRISQQQPQQQQN